MFGAKVGGIGGAVVEQLLRRGHRVVAAGRSAETLTALTSKFDVQALPPLDASRFDEVDSAVCSVLDEHDRLDGAINCVGSIFLKPAHGTKQQDFEAVLATNLTSAFAVTRAAAKAMQRQKSGSIVLMSTVAARVGLPNHEAIAAAKAGVLGLGLSAAATYANRGVRVNVVAPGLTETAMAEPLLRNAASRTASEQMHPLGRIGRPREIASLIAWLLADPDSSWVTGQAFGMDGGLSTVRTTR